MGDGAFVAPACRVGALPNKFAGVKGCDIDRNFIEHRKACFHV